MLTTIAVFAAIFLAVGYFALIVPKIVRGSTSRVRMPYPSRFEGWGRRIMRRQCSSVTDFCTSINYRADQLIMDRRIAGWRRDHPYGPTSLEESRQLDELMFEQAGLLLAECADLNRCFSLDNITSGVPDPEGYK